MASLNVAQNIMERNAIKCAAQSAVVMELVIKTQVSALMDALIIGLENGVINVRTGNLGTIAACIAVPIVWNTVTRIPEYAYKDVNLDGKEILAIKRQYVIEKNKCDVGYYGIGCWRKCSEKCKAEETCDAIRGHCPNGCEEGFIGEKCDS
ncbi:hypothetical protein B566_EDAN013075, partial [Ephemera danica]